MVLYSNYSRLEIIRTPVNSKSFPIELVDIRLPTKQWAFITNLVFSNQIRQKRQGHGDHHGAGDANHHRCRVG